MDHIWTPWRYRYVTSTGGSPDGNDCVFCRIQASDAGDRENLIVFRARHNFVILNRFPYTSGHSMVIPYQHLAKLSDAPLATLEEMTVLTQRLEGLLFALYRPDGVNIGMNVGRAAGAGVAGHIHMHALPRWVADSNFATVIGETRILPEELDVTWRRLSAEFEREPL